MTARSPGAGLHIIARLAPHWRLLDSGLADGASNMAVDLALLEHARATGTATLRVYGWSTPTLSLGRHERARGMFDPAHLLRSGVDVVRRPTGGRALLHHREVTYSVTAPMSTSAPHDAYRAINAVLLDALGRLGVHAVEQERTKRPLRPEGAACFAEPGAGELVLGGAKLVGSAQLRDGGALLQHGSILLEDDQGRIAELREPARGGAIAIAATLGSALGRAVRFDEVRDALATALATACVDMVVTSPRVVESDSGVRAAIDRHRAHFLDPAWTWRR